MKQYRVYYNTGLEHEDRTVDVYGKDIQEALDNFRKDHEAWSTVLAIIEAGRTL